MQKVCFDYQGTHYELGFSRRTARDLEQAGFNIYELDSKPLTRIPQLWDGAFLLYHRRTPTETRSEIYHKMSKKDELIQRLGECYMDAVATLIDEEATEDFIEWGQE